MSSPSTFSFDFGDGTDMPSRSHRPRSSRTEKLRKQHAKSRIGSDWSGLAVNPFCSVSQFVNFNHGDAHCNEFNPEPGHVAWALGLRWAWNTVPHCSSFWTTQDAQSSSILNNSILRS